MARSLWSGSISFGLVNIPVKLFTAVSPKEVHFHMVHDADGARIKQKRVCSADGKEIPYEHIAKGYETSPGEFVVVTREELEAVDPKATRSIDIEEFVALDEIDPIYYETTYYVVPDRGAGKAYSLLVAAMRGAKKVGIARVVLRTRQYLCAIRPLEHALAMSTMLYQDEVNSPSELEGAAAEQFLPKGRELGMAGQLIESLAAKFEPAKYHDEYREKVLDLIHKKAKGQQIVAPPQETGRAKVINLMDALKASLASVGRSDARVEPKRAGPPQKRRPDANETAKQRGRKRKKSA